MKFCVSDSQGGFNPRAPFGYTTSQMQHSQWQVQRWIASELGLAVCFADCLEDCNCPGGHYWDTIFKERLPGRLMRCQQSTGSSLLLKFFVELFVVDVWSHCPLSFYVPANHLEFFCSNWKQKSVKIGSFVLLSLWMWNTLWDLPWFYHPESLFTLCFIGEYSGMPLYLCPVAERAENKSFLWH